VNKSRSQDRKIDRVHGAGQFVSSDDLRNEPTAFGNGRPVVVHRERIERSSGHWLRLNTPYVCARNRGERGTYRRYDISLYTYTRGEVNALSPPAEAAEEILISRFFVELFLASPGLPPLRPRRAQPHVPIPTKAEARKSSSRPVDRGINLQSRKQDGALSILLIKCQQLNCAGTGNGWTAMTETVEEGGKERRERKRTFARARGWSSERAVG